MVQRWRPSVAGRQRDRQVTGLLAAALAAGAGSQAVVDVGARGLVVTIVVLILVGGWNPGRRTRRRRCGLAR